MANSCNIKKQTSIISQNAKFFTKSDLQIYKRRLTYIFTYKTTVQKCFRTVI